MRTTITQIILANLAVKDRPVNLNMRQHPATITHETSSTISHNLFTFLVKFIHEFHQMASRAFVFRQVQFAVGLATT